MKWYFCINQEALEKYADLIRIAVRSCRANTSLEPHLIYDGGRAPALDWLQDQGVAIHPCRTALWPDILAHPEGPGYRHRIAAGAFLRLEVTRIEQIDEVVLYTDVDVFFQRDVAFDGPVPRFIAAGPEHQPDDWTYFNSGVLLLNVGALQRSYAGLLDLARRRLAIPHGYDQLVYNEFFKGRWDRLPITHNWKPYWGINAVASIIHFHGPKPDAIRFLLEGGQPVVVHDIWRELFERNRDSYAYYLDRVAPFSR
jgi:hypothetical protein